MDKKYNKQAIKDMLYGTINELTSDRTFYYRGISDHFNHITEDGKEQLIVLLDRIIPLIKLAEDEEIAERAKDITFDILKDDKK